MKFKLGCHKDKRDDRDYLMRAYLPYVKIPKRVDYTSKMTPVRNQGDEGTCVGFASAVGMKEYQEKLGRGRIPMRPAKHVQDIACSICRDSAPALSANKQKLHSGGTGVPPLQMTKAKRLTDSTGVLSLQMLSPRFLYSECKKLDGYPGQEGTEIRIAMKVLKNLGVCREELWRYEPHDENGPDAPVRKMKADALKNRVKSYARILDLDELRMSLASKGPCVIGIICYSGIMKTRTGKVPMPKRGERQLGGHAICPVGYDDTAKLVKFKNSWSGDWGNKGYGYLPYAYVNKFMIDAWSSIDIIDSSPLTVAKVLSSIKPEG